ncbi:MAG: DUF3048 domain-containing protein [Actinobacteria bacterium]|nr:DUF3048 domain-containing protein [Actinomycetota bacterium]MBW3649519.1 DUF3048 domain-containing protein [Actinomycetota bacterium]
MHTTRGLAVAVLVLTLAAGCSEAKDATDKAAELVGDKDAQATTTTEEPKSPAPLTGKPVAGDVARRPAVSVKVDNSPDGRPQAGLDKADVIFEEKVEGGVTRFVSVFQSQDSELVGPIRSLRTSDPDIVSAVGGVFVFSDGVAISLRRLKGAPVKVVSERDGAAAFTYPKGRRRPYATFAATGRLRKEAARDARTPPALFPFLAEGEAFAPTGAVPASKASVNYGGRTTGTFDFDATTATWLRSTNGTPHLLADGSRLAFSNVIIQFVPYKRVGYKDSSGAAVDEAMVVGAGDAIVLVAGRQVRAKWSKPTPTAVTTFTDSTGAPIELLSGNTLVALPPVGAPVTVS